MWYIVKFVLFGWKRCVIQIPINYESTTNQTNQKSERFVGKEDYKKKKNHVCDLLFLVKRHECLH